MSDPAIRSDGGRRHTAAHGPAPGFETRPGTDGNDATLTGAATAPPAGSVGHLLRQLVDDVATLVRKELALATSEISHSVHEAKVGATSMVTGGAVLYAGLLFLMLAATLGLAEVIPDWGAALVIGGVVALIGLIMVMSGRKKVQPRNFAPDRTAGSLRKDRDLIERQRP